MAPAASAASPALVHQGPDMEISDADFARTSELVRRHFGIHLPEAKRAMVGSRLVRAVRASGCRSFGEYFQRHLQNPDPETLSGLIDAISTNHTYFHREAEHFWLLRDRVLPELMKLPEVAAARDLRVWCAAASSGEEPYTLAMLIKGVTEGLQPAWRGGLLATDISDQALSKARAGVYPTEGTRKLPRELWSRWFVDRPDGTSEVRPELRAEVTYRRLNLMNATFPFKAPFQVIFCRNVMIYFEDDTRRALVERLHHALIPGGYLFIGHAETLSGLGARFTPVQPGVYRKERA